MATARKTVDNKDWISLPNAAKAIGETRHRVLARIVAGELVGQNIAGRTVVSQYSIDRLLAERQKATIGIGQSVEQAGQDAVDSLGSHGADNG